MQWGELAVLFKRIKTGASANANIRILHFSAAFCLAMTIHLKGITWTLPLCDTHSPWCGLVTSISSHHQAP